MTRAFVRGVGAVSALGGDWPSTAAALAAGTSGIAPVTRFDATGMPCGVASVVDDRWLDGGNRDGDGVGDRRVRLARRAAAEAWRMATIDVAPSRIGVFVGAESGLSCWGAAWDLSRAYGPQRDRARFVAQPAAAIAWADPTRTTVPAVAWAIARDVGAAGPCRTIALACASGAAAIVEAVRALRSGSCDAAVCAGVGADVDPLMLAAFGRLGALSARGRSAPFDVGRDGFVLGEGAAALVLSIERGDARAEVTGVARTLDGGSLTAPDPDGRGARRAIASAVADAGGPRIGYVAAHGTATPVGDAAETVALRGILGDDLGGARVGAVKSALGHWIAGAGTLGAASAWHAVANGELLPTVGVDRVGDDCVLPHILGRAEHAPVAAALVDAFGFGGANACLVIGAVA